MPTARLEALGVGGYKVDHLDVLVLDLPTELQIDGLLGMGFLGRFRVTLEIDSATLVLRSIDVL